MAEKWTYSRRWLFVVFLAGAILNGARLVVADTWASWSAYLVLFVLSVALTTIAVEGFGESWYTGHE